MQVLIHLHLPGWWPLWPVCDHPTVGGVWFFFWGHRPGCVWGHQATHLGWEWSCQLLGSSKFNHISFRQALPWEILWQHSAYWEWQQCDDCEKLHWSCVWLQCWGEGQYNCYNVSVWVAYLWTRLLQLNQNVSPKGDSRDSWDVSFTGLCHLPWIVWRHSGKDLLVFWFRAVGVDHNCRRMQDR